LLKQLANGLIERGELDVKEGFIDGSFRSGKKRGLRVGKTKRGKGSKSMAITNSAGIPFYVCVTSATLNEVKLVKKSLSTRFVKKLLTWLIGDRADNSDALDRD